MTRDPLVIVATLSLAGLAFFLLIEHVPKWVRALASSKPFDGIRTALAPIALPGWIKTLGVLAWSALLVTLLAGMFFVILTGLAKLPGITPDTAPDLRWYLLTLTAVTAALGAIIALPFTLRRTVQNERQTRTQEEGYITQQINEAVANLAAQKEVNKVGRVISYQPANPDERWFTTYETVDDRHRVAPEIDGSTIKKSAWEPVKITEPNIEVRIGAILALERLARQRAEAAVQDLQTALITEPEWRRRVTLKLEQAPGTKKRSVYSDELKRLQHRTPDGVLNHDGARDHMRIMEILTAYIRENAPGSGALDRPSWGEQSEEHLKEWTDSLKRIGLRTDISALLRVLGRRTPEQRACEGLLTPNPSTLVRRRQNLLWHGKRLDLSNNNYQGADLDHSEARPLDLAYSDLSGARMEGAVLRAVRLEGTNLREARMEGADLSEARMEGSNLSQARMERADFSQARMEGAMLAMALMEGADLSETHLESSNLSVARMERANLSNSRMEGASLRGTFFEGAYLNGTTFDQATDCFAMNLRGAAMRSLDLSGVSVLPDILAAAFGDASVSLPDGFSAGSPPLAHWSAEELEYEDYDEEDSPFHIAWRAFQNEIGYEPTNSY